MKFIAYILTIVVIALTVYPCIDEPAGNIFQKNELTQSSNSTNHQNESDHCSPFCTCQCCQTNFYISNIISLDSSTGFEISYTKFSRTFLNVELFDFFIPPKS